jgi:hypothetical protein
VASYPYKIYYTDGYTQVLPKVWRQYRDGDQLVFQDEDAEVLRVQTDKVFRVTRTDQPPEDYEGPEPPPEPEPKPPFGFTR